MQITWVKHRPLTCKGLSRPSLIHIHRKWAGHLFQRSINKLITLCLFVFFSFSSCIHLPWWRAHAAGGQRSAALLVSVEASTERKEHSVSRVLRPLFQLLGGNLSSARNTIQSCTHLLPTPLHDDVDGVWSQAWFKKPEP